MKGYIRPPLWIALNLETLISDKGGQVGRFWTVFLDLQKSYGFLRLVVVTLCLVAFPKLPDWKNESWFLHRLSSLPSSFVRSPPCSLKS